VLVLKTKMCVKIMRQVRAIQKMIDQRFMDDLAKDFVLPTEKQTTLLASNQSRDRVGTVTVTGYQEPQIVTDVMQEGAGMVAKPSGVRVGRGGLTVEQSAQAGGLDRPLMALADMLAGATRGAVSQTIGIGGDVEVFLLD